MVTVLAVGEGVVVLDALLDAQLGAQRIAPALVVIGEPALLAQLRPQGLVGAAPARDIYTRTEQDVP